MGQASLPLSHVTESHKSDMRRSDSPSPLLEFDNATVFVGETKALDGVTFRIDAGENVAIIGPNGSGKSTLIRTITRELYPVTKPGDSPIRIMGESIWNVFELRSMLGIISTAQERLLDLDISGMEMVLSGFFSSAGIYPHQHVTPSMEKLARESLEFLEAEHLAEKSVTAMSTGEARRVLVARALAHKPKALMLDEPLNGLDPRAARRFLGMLRKIARSGRTIILVTHHLPDIIPEIDRLIMMKDGGIFLDGPKAQVLTAENLSELFRMPVEITVRDGYYHLWG